MKNNKKHNIENLKKAENRNISKKKLGLNILLIISVFLSLNITAFSENKISLMKKETQKENQKENINSSETNFLPTKTEILIPTVLMSYGFLAHSIPELRIIDYNIKDFTQKNFSTETRIDDYLRAIPIIGVFALEKFGYEAKNKLSDRIIVGAVSSILYPRMIVTLKNTKKVLRPDGSNRLSFPSGHSAEVFAGAQMLYREYGENYPEIAVGGYIIAGLTGLMRITNNKHWFSDVVTGAGIGMIFTEFTYLMLPGLKAIIGFDDFDENLYIYPLVSEDRYEFVIEYKF